MERKKITLNESQLRNIVLTSLKRVLREEYEHGVDVDDAMGQEGDVKGKNWFANHGIVNWKSNNESPVKVYVTTTFLGNHCLAGKLGANWTTAARKPYFNRYTVDSDAILVVVNDTKNGQIYQAQVTAEGPQIVADANDRQVDTSTIGNMWFMKHIQFQFQHLLKMTQDMCAQEDEFFNSKTSKTYQRFNGETGSRYNDKAMRNDMLGNEPDADY